MQYFRYLYKTLNYFITFLTLVDSIQLKNKSQDGGGFWIDAIIDSNWNFLDYRGQILNYSNIGITPYANEKKIMFEAVSFLPILHPKTSELTICAFTLAKKTLFYAYCIRQNLRVITSFMSLTITLLLVTTLIKTTLYITA